MIKSIILVLVVVLLIGCTEEVCELEPIIINIDTPSIELVEAVEVDKCDPNVYYYNEEVFVLNGWADKGKDLDYSDRIVILNKGCVEDIPTTDLECMVGYVSKLCGEGCWVEVAYLNDYILAEDGTIIDCELGCHSFFVRRERIPGTHNLSSEHTRQYDNIYERRCWE